MRVLGEAICAAGIFLVLFATVGMFFDVHDINQQRAIFSLGVALGLIGLAIDRKAK